MGSGPAVPYVRRALRSCKGCAVTVETMLQMLGEGFVVSLQIFVFTLVGALPLGIPVALMRMSRLAPVRWVARIYISVMRGTPLMLQMFAI